ncbi:Aprataxin and PNK-like factor [Eufriesea mexicana]|uniref:Aprataxin and PNK-like factor n=1 Tax=Eufriesea mexicana TaxID=516756 RepID=A0A310SHY9_9HYME|nr:Aprataxin and PNK-like factor [Eufriesea mexicana]
MKKLQILRLDNDTVQKVDLEIGSNIISRSVTGCDDDRVIKQAAIINLTSDNEMTIIPVSPCYMKSIESSRWQFLKLGVTVPIKPGDICTLVLDKCWFKIISVSDKMENNKDNTLKRKLCSESGEGDNLNNNNDIIKVTTGENVINKNNLPYDEIKDKIQDLNCGLIYKSQSTYNSSVMEKDDYEVQNINENTSINDKTLNLKENFDVPSIQKDNGNVTTIDTKSSILEEAHGSGGLTKTVVNDFRRTKCKYGKECYRRSSQHKTKFSHPEDSDYDLPDNREECPYGIQCYRKNPQHKIQFKHTSTNVTSKHNRRSRKQTQIQTALETVSGMEDSSVDESDEESIDESEYDPSSDIESLDDEEMYSDENESEQQDDMID